MMSIPTIIYFTVLFFIWVGFPTYIKYSKNPANRVGIDANVVGIIMTLAVFWPILGPLLLVVAGIDGLANWMAAGPRKKEDE